MPEHLIRLRGGWECLDPGGLSPPRRVTLPSADLAGAPDLVHLSRWFRPPPLDPDRETLWLRVDAVPGLDSVALNGREVARGPFPSTPLLVPLPEIPNSRNRLTLDARFPTGSAALPAGFLWGEVALVVRRAGEEGTSASPRPDGG